MGIAVTMHFHSTLTSATSKVLPGMQWHDGRPSIAQERRVICRTGDVIDPVTVERCTVGMHVLSISNDD